MMKFAAGLALLLANLAMFYINSKGGNSFAESLENNRTVHHVDVDIDRPASYSSADINQYKTGSLEEAEDISNVSTLSTAHNDFRLQILLAGLPVEDVVQIFDCLNLAGTIHGGQYRSTARLFIEHVLGSASCTAHLTRDANLICTALLHDVYFTRWSSGNERPDLLPGASPKDICKARAYIRGIAGEIVEKEIWRMNFYPHIYGVYDFFQLGMKSNIFTDQDVQIMKMVLCDEAEDMINGAQWWAMNHKLRTRNYIMKAKELAMALDSPLVANLLEVGYNWTCMVFPDISDFNSEQLTQVNPQYLKYQPAFEHAAKTAKQQPKYEPFSPATVIDEHIKMLYNSDSQHLLANWIEIRDNLMNYCDNAEFVRM